MRLSAQHKFCAWCGGLLTAEQFRRGARYCSNRCHGLDRRSTATRHCAYCAREFVLRPRHPRVRFCSVRCYALFREGHPRPPLSAETEASRRQKISARLRLTANKSGLLIGQAAPSRISTGIANRNSKRWLLASPNGVIHEVFGLRSWAKANATLFGEFDPGQKTPAHLIILQRLSVVASGHAEHYRHWKVLERGNLPLEKHLAALKKLHEVSRARKAARRRERRERPAKAMSGDPG